MEQVVEDQQLLRSYVEFVGAQCHRAIEDEQQQYNKQVPLSVIMISSCE